MSCDRVSHAHLAFHDYLHETINPHGLTALPRENRPRVRNRRALRPMMGVAMPGLCPLRTSFRRAVLPMLLAAALASCWRYDPLYCDEQADCADNPGLTFCDLNGTFPASEGIGRTCIPDPGGTCVIDDDCDDPLPACVSGVCRECSATRTCGSSAPVCDLAASTCGDCRNDDDCAAFSDQTLCASDGACVGCRDDNDCLAEGSACDEETRQCTGCMQDSDCDSGICNEGPKTCVPAANILYVTATGTGTDCTKTAPCGTIAQAHQRVAGLRTNILLGPGAYDGGDLRDKGFRLSGTGATIVTPLALEGAISIENIAFRAQVACRGTERIHLDSIHISDAVVADSAGGALQVEGATVVVTGSTIERTQGASGARVSAGSLDLSRTLITTSQVYGVNLLVAEGELKVDRTTIIANGIFGLAITIPRYSITNSIIANNGAAGVYLGASINQGQIEHNTIVGNRSGGGEDTGGIRCDSSSAAFRNNIFSDNTPTVTGQQITGCSATYSVFWPTNAPAGAGNIKADPKFAAPATNDFHIVAESPARRAADPERFRSPPAVTVMDDIDGQPRVATGRADIGADEFAP